MCSATDLYHSVILFGGARSGPQPSPRRDIKILYSYLCKAQKHKFAPGSCLMGRTFPLDPCQHQNLHANHLLELEAFPTPRHGFPPALNVCNSFNNGIGQMPGVLPFAIAFSMLFAPKSYVCFCLITRMQAAHGSAHMVCRGRHKNDRSNHARTYGRSNKCPS